MKCNYFRFRRHNVITTSMLRSCSVVILRNRENKIATYADDSYLHIGSNHLGTAKSEFQHIQSWASRDNLCLNASKTKELIVYKRGGGKCRAPLEVIPG